LYGETTVAENVLLEASREIFGALRSEKEIFSDEILWAPAIQM
jgi:hypothetical protein